MFLRSILFNQLTLHIIIILPKTSKNSPLHPVDAITCWFSSLEHNREGPEHPIIPEYLFEVLRRSSIIWPDIDISFLKIIDGRLISEN